MSCSFYTILIYVYFFFSYPRYDNNIILYYIILLNVFIFHFNNIIIYSYLSYRGFSDDWFAMNSVVLVIVLLLASHVHSSPIINLSWDTPRHFCGSQLANVLALICSHGYNFHPVNDGQYHVNTIFYNN